MNVLILYFSATGNTKKIADVIAEELGRTRCDVAMADITACAERQKTIDLAPYDAFLFGAPIHSWRAPRVVREWMKTLDGRGRKCAMFFTYGGFGVHPTHYSTRQILESRNFIVVSSAEFLGFHTFNLGGWKAMEGRPDGSDFEVAKEFARVTCKRFTGEDTALLGELEKTEHTEEQLDAIESFRFKVLTQLPTRGGSECGMCMFCESVCPTGAMNAVSGNADSAKCIACLACVAVCPEDALHINDMSSSWSFKLQMEKISVEAMKEKKSRIYR
ncbi:MAG TPA: EFR1 family ferrodoxin [Spirochaetota bacterium]|nr:EFR1 family ferrodoxin [Spirochaetota bacterium]HPI90115.1 EFR1 family ferrodoxin [Spirochaetota bacterium]HPR49555.1 EFR1 family ferrodoxin [Spirochaetota bacterium]